MRQPGVRHAGGEDEVVVDRWGKIRTLGGGRVVVGSGSRWWCLVKKLREGRQKNDKIDIVHGYTDNEYN